MEFLGEKGRDYTKHILCNLVRRHMEKNGESQEPEKQEYRPKTIVETIKEECESMEAMMESMSKNVVETLITSIDLLYILNKHSRK